MHTLSPRILLSLAEVVKIDFGNFKKNGWRAISVLPCRCGPIERRAAGVIYNHEV